MIIKRFFSAPPTRRLFIEILNENSGVILALGVIGSGSFGIGLYLNQMKVYEEKLKAVKMEAKKDTLFAEEKLKAVKMEAKKDTLLAEERAKKDALLAEERAKKEALEHLYNIFTQEEFKDAKKKMMAQKNKIVNSE